MANEFRDDYAGMINKGYHGLVEAICKQAAKDIIYYNPRRDGGGTDKPKKWSPQYNYEDAIEFFSPGGGFEIYTGMDSKPVLERLRKLHYRYLNNTWRMKS